MARKSKHSDRKPELCDEIVQRVSIGEPLAAVCRDLGIGVTTVYDWTYADPAFAERISRARADGHDAIAADAMAISDEPPERNANGGLDSAYVAWQKNRVWTRLQLLAKWDPKRYGDRLEIDQKTTITDLTEEQINARIAKLTQSD